MCILAHFSGDEGMIRSIKEGRDLHCNTLFLMNLALYEEAKAAKDKKDAGLPLTQREKWLCDKRSEFKAVGFGIIYGKRSLSLGMDLGLPIVEERYWSRRFDEYRIARKCPEADALIDNYFDTYPGAKAFIDYTLRKCRKKKYVQTIMGRYRRLPDINSPKFMLRSEAERQAVNSIIQGTAGDIVKCAMLSVANSRRLRELGVRMLLQVHDELLFEMPDIPDVREEAKEIIDDRMAHPFEEPLRVPTRVDGKFGYTWLEAH